MLTTIVSGSSGGVLLPPSEDGSVNDDPPVKETSDTDSTEMNSGGGTSSSAAGRTGASSTSGATAQSVANAETKGYTPKRDDSGSQHIDGVAAARAASEQEAAARTQALQFQDDLRQQSLIDAISTAPKVNLFEAATKAADAPDPEAVEAAKAGYAQIPPEPPLTEASVDSRA